MTLFIANLHYGADETDLQDVFREGGYYPSRVAICTDRETGKSRGFGFVDIDDSIGRDAIDRLNGIKISGRAIVVKEADRRT